MPLVAPTRGLACVPDLFRSRSRQREETAFQVAVALTKEPSPCKAPQSPDNNFRIHVISVAICPPGNVAILPQKFQNREDPPGPPRTPLRTPPGGGGTPPPPKKAKNGQKYPFFDPPRKPPKMAKNGKNRPVSRKNGLFSLINPGRSTLGGIGFCPGFSGFQVRPQDFTREGMRSPEAYS